MRLDVEADSLAALMVLDRDLEPVPEPFRMQPDVEVVVNFEEYLKFVQSLPSDATFLYFPTDKLHKSIEARNEQSLIKSFYIDVALAVCKELFFAEYYGRGATVIRHEFYDCHNTKGISVMPDTQVLLLHILSEKGFTLPNAISNTNFRHWDYACKLLQDASKEPTRWVEKM